MGNLKIGVYAIALNEEKFVERWYKSCAAADYILIADTGSTDSTVVIAEKLGINVIKLQVLPFRFDDARNSALSLLPKDLDLCISLDLDEVLADGWYEEIQKTSEKATRLEYREIRRWNLDGSPAKVHKASKIHRRTGFRWVNPVHEMLTQYVGEVVKEFSNLEIQHFPDENKSRSGYLPLLELSLKENPKSSQLAFWLAREYMIHGFNKKATDSFLEFLDVFPDAWGPERAFAFLFLAKLNVDSRLKYLVSATETAPYLRETWLDLSDYYRIENDWPNCLNSARKAEEITDKPEIYLTMSEDWNGPRCFDLIALSSHFMGDNLTAVHYGGKAFDLRTNDDRLKNNLAAYKRALKEQKLFAGDLNMGGKHLSKKVITEEEIESLPRVLWAIIVKDSEHLLSLYLKCLIEQSYPKEKIFLYIRTNDNRDNTEVLLSDFIESYGGLYLGVKYDASSVTDELKFFGQHEWNETRFAIMGKLRQESIAYATKNDFDFYFCSDVDNFLMPESLEHLISLNLPVVAPLLRVSIPNHREPIQAENNNYSNFHDKISSGGSFQETDRYFEIMRGEISGLFEVELVHCTYLVKREAFNSINYELINSYWEYRNFALSCAQNGVKQYIDARCTFGFITFGHDQEDVACAEKYLDLIR